MSYLSSFIDDRRTRLAVGQLVIVCLVLMTGGLRTAAAETTQCVEITSLPAVINRSGVHCLKRDLIYRAKTGAAITVVRNNVVLDFNGYRIYGVPATDTEAVGVRIPRRNKVHITNGTIERFQFGVYASGGLGLLVDNILFDQNRQFGVWIDGRSIGATIRKNLISRSGGSAVPVEIGFAYSAAINVNDASALNSTATIIEDNTIVSVPRVSGSALRAGIASFGEDTTVQRNQVFAEVSVGITLGSAPKAGLVAENRVSNNGDIASGIGISMAGATVIFKNNTSHNFSTPFFGGIDGGDNDATP